MSTRQVKDARNTKSGEKIYFKGHAKATYMSNGKTVEDSINEVLQLATENEQNITDEIDRATQAELDAIEKGRQLALRSLFLAAGAEYNDTGEDIQKTTLWGETVTHKAGYYYLNGLGDITEEQMTHIYNAGRPLMNVPGIYYKETKIRTNLPNHVGMQEGIGNHNITGFAYNCYELEILSVVDYDNKISLSTSGTPYHVFWNCKKLKRVFPVIRMPSNTQFELLTPSPVLQYLYPEALNNNWTLTETTVIEKECLLFAINKSLKTTPKNILLKLHADVYAKCVEGGEWYDEINTALTTANAAFTAGGSINIATV